MPSIKCIAHTCIIIVDFVGDATLARNFQSWYDHQGIEPYFFNETSQGFVGAYSHADAERILQWFGRQHLNGILVERKDSDISWNPELFKRLDMNPESYMWSFRTRKRLEHHGLTHVADLLRIRQRISGSTVLIDRSGEYMERSLKGLGRKSFHEIREGLREFYNVDLKFMDTVDMGRFPWDLLEP